MEYIHQLSIYSQIYFTCTTCIHICSEPDTYIYIYFVNIFSHLYIWRIFYTYLYILIVCEYIYIYTSITYTYSYICVYIWRMNAVRHSGITKYRHLHSRFWWNKTEKKLSLFRSKEEWKESSFQFRDWGSLFII